MPHFSYFFESTSSGGLVTNWRTQTCGEARFKDTVKLQNPNMPKGKREFKKTIYLNEDYAITWHTRKIWEQIQARLVLRGVTTQLLIQVANDKGEPPDFRTRLSNFAPVYSDADSVTELPT